MSELRVLVLETNCQRFLFVLVEHLMKVGLYVCASLPHICKKKLVLSISLKVCLYEGFIGFGGVLK